MKKLLLFCLTLSSFSAFPAIKTVVDNTGQGWGTASNWSPSGVPVSGDEVIIPAGQTISVKGSFYAGSGNLIIRVSGTLDFDPSGKLDLGASSEVHLLSGSASITTSGTSSELIIINGVTKYNGSIDGVIFGPRYATNSTGTSPSGFAAGILPVRILTLTAKLKGAQINIEWQTAAEINADHFVIEHSVDGINFEEKGTVDAKRTGSTYSFTDPSSTQGVHYYRLRVMDIDGSFEYSKIFSINVKGKILFSVAPNPTTGRITITNNSPGGEKLLIQIIDVNGNKIYNKQHLTGAPITVDMAPYPGGIYIIKVNDNLIRLMVTK